MIRFFNTTIGLKRMAILGFFLFIWVISPGNASAADTNSGITIDLYTPAGSDQTYLLADPNNSDDPGEKIPITMVIKNTSPWKIATRRLFSQSAFHNAIVVNGPNGETYFPKKETRDDDMPAPVFWSDGKKTRELISAELLEKDWVKSVTIPDLRELVPAMYELPGAYVIEASQPFVRFAWTTELDPHGLMGVVDDRNWTGAVSSENKIKIIIAPADGARVKVRVEDLSSGNAVPVGMHAVRVFKGKELNLADAWKKGSIVMAGRTDLNGWAVWESGDPCLPLDTYTIVARYKNSYEQVVIRSDDSYGWAPECSGQFSKNILFGKIEEKYVVYATNSVSIGNNVTIHGGNIGVPDSSDGPWLSGKVAVDIGNNVLLDGDAKIIGDSVSLSSSASVNDLYYNNLSDAGADINGLLCTPIEEPVAEGCEPGVTWNWIEGLGLPADIDVDRKNSVSIYPEMEVTLPRTINNSIEDPEYWDIILEPGATLKLSGGVYHFRNLYMASNSTLLCDSWTEIRILERLHPGSKSFIGISSQGISNQWGAKDVVIYVAGQNGKKGFLNSVPEAAVIGEGSNIHANIYAPNGTIRIKEGCEVTGSFVAADVAIGQKVSVSLDSYFQP